MLHFFAAWLAVIYSILIPQIDISTTIYSIFDGANNSKCFLNYFYISGKAHFAL